MNRKSVFAEQTEQWKQY